MSTDANGTDMFNVQNIYGTPQVSRRQVIKPRRLTLIDLRNLTGADEEGTHRKGSSGTIKSESGISNLKSAKQVSDVSEASRRAVATMKVKNIPTPSSGLSVANSGQVKLEQTRFPKLEEYAHFHYDLVEIPTLKLSLCTDDASGYKHNTELSEDSGMFLVTVLGSAPKSWLIKRSLENFATLDVQLHRCIFDRRFSHLNDLSAGNLKVKPRQEVLVILHSYLTHLSELAGGMINCGSVLSWMEMDNRGHRLVATDDSGINTPAIAAAHVIKRYNAQAADEITLQVGDMISVIDMPSAEDTIWWRGKRGFEVGFFPAECVEIIGDKIPISMATRIPEPVATASASRRPCENLEELSTTTITATSSLSSTPSPSSSRYSASTTSSLVGNVSLSSSSPESSPAMMKKHGKLLSFLRTFFSHRPPRNQLKQSGIVKERVFGCDLGEHLLNSGHDVPLLLKSCTDIIEEYGIVHGIYRLSGITSNIQKLRLAFDEDRVPDLTDDCYLQDIHSISSLLKMYFRELPNPLLTYQLYDKFADAVRDEDNKLLKIHDVVQQLPPPHYRTTEYLMRHLARVAAFGHETEMHSKNLAIVWAPNLLRSKELEAGGGAAALQGVGIQAVVTECLICYCDIIFSDKMPDYNSQDSMKGQKKARPKSLAISTPTRLLSLEEARERAFVGHMAPKKFIDVGGGPRNLPSKYHTVIDLPGYRKRAPSTSSENKPASGNKKMSTTCGGGGGGGWKSIFIKPRSGSIKKSRKFGPQDSMTLGPAQGKALTEEDVHNWKRHLRSAKSAESLFSLMNTHSSHGSLSSRTSISVSETVIHAVPETSIVHSQGLASKFQLSHKRSLSSDASAILHHCCSTTEAALHPQTPDDKDKQCFKRGDSARIALHRRLPSAPNTPHEDRKSIRDMVSSNEVAGSGEISSLQCSHSQYEGDMNIHAKINSRLLQVAEKTRSAKSQEELTSPLKRMATCSPKGSKKAKGAGDFHVGSSDDELPNLVTEKKIMDSSSCMSDTSPFDSSKALRTFYSRFHDYAEIVSDDDMAIISTPDSQGAMSVSSSGCNMQDVLDQIDTRLALNAKLFPRQGIGDTSGYRVGDPPHSFVDTSILPRNEETVISAGTDLATTILTTSSTSINNETEFSVHTRESPIGKSVCSDDLSVANSPRELCQLLEGTQTWQVDDSTQHNNMLHSVEIRRGQENMRTAADKPSSSAAISTLVGRRHTEFIPSLTAAARDLHNLHELLNSLTADDSQLDIQTRVPVLPKNYKSSRNSIAQIHHDHSTSKMSKQKPSTTAASFESKFDGTKVEGRLANMSAGGGGGGMSKCLSVPSDIARSLENVTESQSDMLSSVTISELSASINSFSNGLGQEAAIVADGARVQIEGADRRHRRSTSLDSLTESDRLMTRTLREINSQMEAAFQHNKMNNSGCSLDSLPHHQRLAVSDLELTSAGFYDHRNTVEIKADVNDGMCSENHLLFSHSNITTLSSSDRLRPSIDRSSFLHSETGASSEKLSHATLCSPSSSNDFVSKVKNSMTSACLELDIVENHTISDLSPTSCFISSGLSLSDEEQQQQCIEVRQRKDFDEECLESTFNHESRLTEKQTHRQSDEHIIIESTHVVKFKSPDLDMASQQYRHTAPSRQQQHLQSRSDIASVCTNRSSSSSSCTSSEDYDEVAELSEEVSYKCNFALPLGNISLPLGNIVNETLTEAIKEVHNPSERKHQGALHVSLPASDLSQYHVVRRQHSPRVEQKSPRFNLNIDGTKADFGGNEDAVEASLFSSDSQLDDTEACEQMSSLCAVGLMSQRVRLSRDSSVSSLHSPDTSSPCILSASAQSPLETPVREALPDLIQSTAQIDTTDADNRRCSVPLQLALYHPDEFSVDIAASVSSHLPSCRCTSLHPSPSLPQVHSLSHTVVVTKSTLTKSSTDNSLSEVSATDKSVSDRRHLMYGLQTRKADSHDVRLEQASVTETRTLLQSSYSDSDGISRENRSMQNTRTSRDEGDDAFSHDFITKTNHIVRPSRGTRFSEEFNNLCNSQVAMEFNNLCNRQVDDCQSAHFTESQSKVPVADCKLSLLVSEDGENHHSEQVAVEIEVMDSEPSSTDEERVLRPCDSLDTDSQMFFLHSSDPAMEKEEAQNVVNQGREILMSPELIDKSELREKSYQSLQSPSAVPVRRTSFSKIPRPKQTYDLTSPRSTNNGTKKTDFLYSSSVTSTVHVDTSPSSSSSSASSSSRVGHTRRGSEASSTTKRQCHIRRSSDTKLTDLQTLSPVSRCHSSSSNRPDLSGTGRPVTSPRNRGFDNKTGSADIGGKSSRIPLSHRIPSPQSNRGTDATSLGMSKQISKIPSPIPKPRKLNLSSKGSHTPVSAEGNSSMKQCRTDISGRVASSKAKRDVESNSAVKRDAESNSALRREAESSNAVRRDADSSSKKTIVVKDMSSKSGANLVIESQTDLNKVQTVHATKVSQPTRQVAGSDPATHSKMTTVHLDNDENSTFTVTSSGVAMTQSPVQTEVRIGGGDKKTPPPVAVRKFTYDSRSLPRRCKFLETQISFPGQQSCCELYSDMLGSRSSLDDSILQLAAERHDLFVPDNSEDGGSYSHCLSSLRVKRSQKMQSLMDLFERGSDSNVSDSSATHSPGTQHRVRTFSGSVIVQGGLLTPCVEAGLGDLSTVDDDTFLPPTSECDDTWFTERFPSRAGTVSGQDGSSKENSESAGNMRAQGKYNACLCSSVSQSQGRDLSHGSAAEQRSTSFKQIAEKVTSQHSSPSTFDEATLSNSLKPPHHYHLPESRTRSNSSSDSGTVHHTNVFTSRPSSFSGTDLQLRACGSPHLTDTHQPSAFDRQHSSLAFIDATHRQTEISRQLFETENAHNSDNELHKTMGTSRGSSVNTPPPSPRKNAERRNSIKELRQLFERPDQDDSTTADNGPSNPDGQPAVVRSRVRSISPQTDHEQETRRDKVVRLSLEIPSNSVTCQSSQSEVKIQPLRLGPKPFYGVHK